VSAGPAKVVATNRVFAETRALFDGQAEFVAPEGETPLSGASRVAALAEAQGMMAFMTDRVDAALLSGCPRLQVIGAALKGHDNIDLVAAERAGVTVCIVPDLLTVPTAELAIGLMLALGRHIVAADRTIREAGFAGWRPRFYGTGIAGMTVGIVGHGAVGRAISARLAGFECRILTHDPSRGDPTDGLDTLLGVSDWVILAAPLTPANVHLVDAAALARMKPGALLVNPARGSLVDEAAVADALEDGRLAGYAADVFECEDAMNPQRPTEISARLASVGAPTVLTPHIGSAVERVRREIERAAATAILDALAGRAPAGRVAGPERRC